MRDLYVKAGSPPVIIEINGNSFSSFPGGTVNNINVFNVVNQPVGSKIGDDFIIDFATLTITDQFSNQLGQVQVLPETNSGVQLNIPDNIIEFNNQNIGSIPYNQDVDIQLTDGTNPITPDNVSVVGNVVTVEILPTPSVSRSTARLMKTGQTTSYVTGDDGDIQAGRETDFLTLLENNPFGNKKRFTGVTGGYREGGVWRDVNGNNVGSQTAAFPDNIYIDWSTYNGTIVLGYGLNDFYAFDLNKDFTQLCTDGLAYSIGTYTSGWRGVNDVEGRNIMNRGSALALNYEPFSINASAVFNTITTNPQTTANCFVITNNWGAISAGKTGARKVMYTRDFTVTGTTLN